MIRIIIADAQKLFRESLKCILEQDEEFKVVGCAENGLEAIKLCDENLPDVVLMDLKMPVCDGIEGTKLIKANHPQIKIIMLTMSDEDQSIRRALENWADGYILKDVTPEELKRVIKNVTRGFGVISKKAYDTLLLDFQKCFKTPVNHRFPLNIRLKDHEMNIIRFVADGKNNREIASCLCLSEGRIKNIVSKLLSKLNLKDRYQLLSFAYKYNLHN